jgi:hypothetical protein
MRRLVLILLLGCADHKGSTNEPVITGDKCEAYADPTACAADSTCRWYGTGCACPPNDPSCTCSGGVCASAEGTGSGSGSAMAACACSNGEVCFEQIGGPAVQSPPQIDCTLPASGTGDPCPRIQNQGTCMDSTTISGLCICDNGIR